MCFPVPTLILRVEKWMVGLFVGDVSRHCWKLAAAVADGSDDAGDAKTSHAAHHMVEWATVTLSFDTARSSESR